MSNSVIIHICPCCGADITEVIRKADSEKHRAAALFETDRKTAARKRNMERLNAAYSSEKRKAAAQKRLETIRKKRKTAI